MGRPISLTQPGSAVTSSAYAGDQTLVTDPAGVLKLVATDRFGRVTSVNENPTGAWNGGSNAGGTGTTYTTSYMYDPLDDLTNVAQGSLKARVFQYDWLKRLMSANNPESGTITYMYDASSNLMQRVDALNVTTTYAYDGMNRAVSKIYSGGTTATPSVLYCYDGAISSNGNTSCNGTLTGSNLKGQMTYVGTSSSMTEYTNFDSVRRLLSSMQSTGGSNYLFSYTYNLASDLSTETYPSGRQITYAYDVANRVTSAMGLFNTVTTPYASNVTYAPQGPISTLQMGSGVTEAWTFDGVRQQPISMTATLAGTQLLNLGWSWVPTVNSKPATQYDNGNLLSASTTRNVNSTSYTYSQAYTYDAYNRLTSATETNGWTQTYNYDAYGNRAVTAASYIPNMSLTPTALTQFNGNNQWTGGTSSAGYDNSGNQIADNGTGNAFTYDAENRMVTANVAATGNVNYVYDGAGKRVQKYWTSSTCTGSLCSTTYVYDGMGQLAAEYSDLTGSATGTEYLSVDTLGSTRLITNNAGGSPECLDYLPFGEEVPGGENGRPSCYTSGAYPNSPDPEGSRKFTGKERDAETGLDYFGARYMSSAQGRFTSPDPKQEPHDITDPQSWNKYAYTRNNPLRYTDPDGEDFWDAVKGTINAFTSDNAFGAGRINSGNSDFHTGQAVGDAIATVTGTAEALFGGGEAIVTSPAALTVAGAVIPAAGLTTAVHGGTTAAIAGSHLAAAAFADNNQQSSGEGSQLVGNNPRDAKGRTNTDLPGGHEAAKDTFGKLTSGQDVAVDPKTGHQVAADGTRLRLNPDGTARVDVPSSQTNPKRETVHFNNPDKPQQ
jgi:RHS repeat-associated protein